MVVNRSAPRTTVVPVLVYEDVAKALDCMGCTPPRRRVSVDADEFPILGDQHV